MYNVLFDHVSSQQNLKIWLFIIFITLIIRSFDTYFFFKKNEKEQLENHWRTRFYIGTALASCCWGLLPWLGYTPNAEYFAFIVMVIAGVIAGGLSTLSFRWETQVLFMLPSSLLLLAKLLDVQGDFYKSTVLVLIVYVIFSLTAGKRIFNNTQQNIQLRLEADNRVQAIKILHQKQVLHLQNTPLAIIEFDPELTITEWNTAAQKIFGYTRSEAINENILRLIILRDNVWRASIKSEPRLNVVGGSRRL